MIAALAIAFQVSAAVPEVVQRARVNPALGVNFAAAIVPDTVAVGQQAVYQVAVFVSDEVRQRLRRNPEFVPPELRALLAYDPPGGYTRYSGVRLGGRVWEAHVFQRVVFPLAAGRVEIPPARLSYALPLSSSFFSREETKSVRSPAVTLVAVDPPRTGRPDDWDGAVGRLAMRARVEPSRARVGDPVTVTLQVSGAGNVNLLPRPRLEVGWGDAVPAGERVTLDSVRLRVSGTKEFDWIVTPRSAGPQTLVAQRYPVFDPGTGQYEIVRSSPAELEIAPGASGGTAGGPTAADASGDDLRLPIRTRWRGEQPAPPWERWPFWVVAALAPLGAAWRWGRARVVLRASAEAGREPERPEAAARRAAANAADTPAARFDGWHRRLRVLVDVPVGADIAALRRALRRAGVTEATADRAVALEQTLATQAYGPARRRPDAAAAQALAQEIASVEAAVAAELAPSARVRRRPWAARAWLAAALLPAALAVAAVAAEPDEAATRFAAGVTAYGNGKLDDARRAFAEAARLAPRADDAWANLGTAAWVAHDTGVAAMGWQRAARLDPSAADVHERLDLLPGSRGSLIAPATVWPIAADWLAYLALAAWVGAALLALGRGGWVRPALGGALAVALAGGALTAVAAWRARADHLYIVATGDRLRILPALGADPVAAVNAGEVVEEAAREGSWRRVRLDDGREGWLEQRVLLGLAQPRRPR